VPFGTLFHCHSQQKAANEMNCKYSTFPNQNKNFDEPIKIFDERKKNSSAKANIIESFFGSLAHEPRNLKIIFRLFLTKVKRKYYRFKKKRIFVV